VLDISPLDSPKSTLQKEDEQFIQEEEESDEVFELLEIEAPTRSPIELKPLPSGL
jgi:hypothetical protein